MPKGVPLTEAELEKRRQEISAVAIPLFVERGFNETSIRQIASAAEMGKSTLYDYFDSKDEILVSYFAAEIELITARSRGDRGPGAARGGTVAAGHGQCICSI